VPSGLRTSKRAFKACGFNLMKPEARPCKCLHCKMLFMPDYRNRGRQKYCSAPECQQVSKRARQQRWLSKPENRDHFRGSENVQRVQQWRKANPGYWKRSPRKAARTLQDACSAQPAPVKELEPVALPEACASTLQDVCQVQAPLIVGLISKFTDCTLQDDIVPLIRRLITRGQDILDQSSSQSAKGNTVYDEQKNPATGALATSAGAV
jgi:hypothetical protein